jgi:signal transduction histidine kinase
MKPRQALARMGSGHAGARRPVLETERALGELRLTSAALERANQDLDRLAYATSHELRASLRGIASLSGWLEEDLAPVLTVKSKEQLRLLHGRVDRMEALIDGILAFSRASRVAGQLTTIEIAPFLHEIVASFSPCAGVVTIDVPAWIPPVSVQVVPFRQVWRNLVANALTHGAAERAAVRLASRDAGEGWEFSVADNGPGIPVRYHERIFRMFQKLAPRDEVEGAGVGVGLSIVKRLVEDRGGRVWVDSAFLGGARVCFTWPK